MYARGEVRASADVVVAIAKELDVTTDELLGVIGHRDGSPLPSLKLLRRVERIERLPTHHQRALLQTIDNFLRGAPRNGHHRKTA